MPAAPRPPSPAPRPPLARPGRLASSRCDRAWERAGGCASSSASASVWPRSLRSRDSLGAGDAHQGLGARPPGPVQPPPPPGTAEPRRLVQRWATGRAQPSAVPKKAPSSLRPRELTAVSEVGGSRAEARLVVIIFAVWEAGVAPLVSRAPAWGGQGARRGHTHAGEAAAQRPCQLDTCSARTGARGHRARCPGHIPSFAAVCVGGGGREEWGVRRGGKGGVQGCRGRSPRPKSWGAS